MNANNERVDSLPIPISEVRRHLSVPLLCDALDSCGYLSQSPRLPIEPRTLQPYFLFGTAKTLLWADMAHVDPKPYELELAAIDSCQPDDVIVCAAGGSMRSGIWGELLSIAAKYRGAAGVLVDGAVRDIRKMKELGFCAYARWACPYDSRDRQRVIDYDVTVELGGVRVNPGDWIAADEDGVVIIPSDIAPKVIEAAWAKMFAENKVRDAVTTGMSTTEAFRRFGVL
jgi:4-hydroxy-4-methyl-2-oxoglutarate aldolase